MPGSSPAGHDRCPVCNAPAAGKHLGGELYYCRNCRLTYNSAHQPLEYSDAYFLEDYRRQYGKTYLEDYENIYRSSQVRMKRILACMDREVPLAHRSLLDLGSAMGFFLKCAADQGFGTLRGIELSTYASNYCSEQLKIPSDNVSFDKLAHLGMHDVISAWYFVEHCASPLGAFQKIYDSLKPGGVFAFSLPSTFGPSFVFNRAGWLSTHPVDHRIDLSPRAAVRIMKKLGFSLVKVYPAGFHPERIMSRESFLFPLFSMVYRFFSYLTAFSDTIEVYAVKTPVSR